MQMLIFKLVLMIIMYLITSRNKDDNSNPAATMADVNVNTAEADRVYPITYGTVKIGGSNCCWYGDLRSDKIKTKGSFFTPSQDTGAYKYYLGFKLLVGFGEVKLHAIHTDDYLVWQNDYSSPELKNFTSNIDMPSVYGDSNDIKDGIKGYFNFWSGTDNEQDPYLKAKILAEVDENYGVDRIPSWSGQSYLSWRGGYVGNSLNMKQWFFTISRVFTPEALKVDGVDYSAIYVDGYPNYPTMNPVYIIFDLMTNNNYGSGKNEVKDIDIENFKQIAKEIYDEGWGLSFYKDSSVSVRDLLDQVQKYANINLILDKSTNKFKLKLIRDDYNVADLQEFNQENIEKISSYSNGAIDNKLNEYKMKWTSLEDFETVVETRQNISARFEKDAVKSNIVDFLFINDPDKVAIIVNREAKATTTELSTIEFDVGYQIAKDLEEGDVIKWSYEPYGVYNKVFRIQKVDLGEGSGKDVRINAIQDVFSLNSTTFVASPGSSWVKPNNTPIAMDLKVVEAPLFFGDEYKLLTFGEAPKAILVNFDFYIDSKFDSSATGFTPSATFVNDYSNSDYDTFVVDGALEELLNFTEEYIAQGANTMMIETSEGYEFASFKTVEYVNGYYELSGLKRGCFDKLSRNITAGNKVYFIAYGSALNSSYDLEKNQQYQIQGLTKSSNMTLKIGEAPIVNYTIDGRKDLPIIAAGLEVNSVLLGSEIPSNTDLSLKWNIRNRVNQSILKDMKVDNEDTLEDNSEYHLDIYDDTNTLIKSEVLTVNNYTFTDETTINPSGVYYNTLRIELKTVNGSLESLEKYDLTLTRI